MQTVAIATVRHAFKAQARRATRLVIAANNVFIVPESFESALRQGWKIESEKSTLEPTKRHRWGTVVLVKQGRPEKLAVCYTATVKNGYEFAKPELMS